MPVAQHLPPPLPLSTLHKRINMNTHPSTYLPNSSTFRNRNTIAIGGRRVGAPRDLAGDAFETRVRAFLNGRFWELLPTSLDVTTAPLLPQNQYHDLLLDPPLPPRSL